MNDRTKRGRLRDPERQNVLRVRVDDRLYVGPRLVDGGVNEPFEIERARLVAHGLPVKPQFDDVLGLDQLGRDGAGEEKMLWIVGMANTDMAVCIHHLLARKDAIGDDEIANDGVEIAHG